MAFAPPRGRRPTIEWVPIGELLVDDSYQRSIEPAASQRLIREIASEWDWDVLDVLKVSRRPDDRQFVVDGQHRLAAARLRGDVPDLPCVMKRCAGPADEARLFLAANRGRRKMHRLDDFRGALGAGDADALAVQRSVDAAGLTLARTPVARAEELPAGELMNVGALLTTLRRHGEPVLTAALAIIGEAFPDETIVAPSAMLGAIVALRDLDPDRVFQTLLAGTTAQWAEWAGLRGLGGQSQLIALRDLIRHRYAGAAGGRKAA